jgi:hypothetical protein
MPIIDKSGITINTYIGVYAESIKDAELWLQSDCHTQGGAWTLAHVSFTPGMGRRLLFIYGFWADDIADPEEMKTLHQEFPETEEWLPDLTYELLRS